MAVRCPASTWPASRCGPRWKPRGRTAAARRRSISRVRSVRCARTGATRWASGQRSARWSPNARGSSRPLAHPCASGGQPSPRRWPGTEPSPHARGAENCRQIERLTREGGEEGIPADAGITTIRPFKAQPVCGTSPSHTEGRQAYGLELPTPQPVWSGARGPSPRARGAHGALVRGRPGAGTIPARAGTTSRRWWARPGRSSYPRVRRDDLQAEDGTELPSELPPRGRGRSTGRGGQRVADRATPAWAGTMSGLPRHSLPTASYPRGCGDDRCAGNSRRSPRELPPRGRGRLRPSGHGLTGVRATPAWAGTTGHVRHAVTHSWSYPRVGGDDVPQKWQKPLAAELPPRGRGRHFMSWDDPSDVVRFPLDEKADRSRGENETSSRPPELPL